jgi:hypothetical protein
VLVLRWCAFSRDIDIGGQMQMRRVNLGCAVRRLPSHHHHTTTSLLIIAYGFIN